MSQDTHRDICKKPWIDDVTSLLKKSVIFSRFPRIFSPSISTFERALDGTLERCIAGYSSPRLLT